MVLSELGLTYIDLVGLICIILFFCIGYARGFITEFLKLGSWVLSLIGAKLLAYPLEGTVYNFFKINEKLDLKLTEIVSQLNFSSVETVRTSLDSSLSNLPFVGKLLNDIVYNNWNLTDIIQKASVNIQKELVNSLHIGIEPIIHSFLHIVVFVVLFFVLMVVTNILLGFLRNVFTSIKIVGGVDKLLGGVFGIIKGLIFFVILYFVLFLVLSLSGSDYLSVLMSSRFYDIFIGIGDVIPK